MSRRRKASAPREISPWPFVGIGLIAVDFFFYAFTGLVLPGAPWWALVLLMLLWAVFLLLGTRWWTPHPRRLPWLGVAAMVLWFALVLSAAAWLGWGPD
jgi:hypothetical protein